MYYPHMPSIVGKRRGQHTYYYLVESARVDGQPRIVSQQYLGTAEEVMARLSGTATGEPARSRAITSSAVPRYCWDTIRGWAPTSPWPSPTGSWTPAPSEGLRTGGPPPPGRGGSSSARPRWTTGGSGMRWTAWARRTCAASRPRWGGGWSASSGWTFRGWCWT